MNREKREAIALAEVLGVNARRLRGGAKADQVARAAKVYGLNWGTGRISDLEHGRVSPTLPTLLALAAALGDIRGEPVSIADLLAYDGRVELTATLTVKGAAVQRFASGQPVKFTARDIEGAEDALAAMPGELHKLAKQAGAAADDIPTRLVLKVQSQQGEAEARVAKSLGVNALTFAAASAQLWGRSLSAERDRRAGKNANAQDRGRITRSLKAEIKGVLNGNAQ